jgi:hypothetical protein
LVSVARSFCSASRLRTWRPADDLGLVGTALEKHRDFGEIARGPRRRAREDDVVHAAAAQRLGGALAHHPADRLEQVGLAAAIGADDPRQPRLDQQLGGIDEALEARKLEPPDPHLARSACRDVRRRRRRAWP